MNRSIGVHAFMESICPQGARFWRKARNRSKKNKAMKNRNTGHRREPGLKRRQACQFGVQIDQEIHNYYLTRDLKAAHPFTSKIVSFFLDRKFELLASQFPCHQEEAVCEGRQLKTKIDQIWYNRELRIAYVIEMKNIFLSDWTHKRAEGKMKAPYHEVPNSFYNRFHLQLGLSFNMLIHNLNSFHKSVVAEPAHRKAYETLLASNRILPFLLLVDRKGGKIRKIRLATWFRQAIVEKP